MPERGKDPRGKTRVAAAAGASSTIRRRPILGGLGLPYLGGTALLYIWVLLTREYRITPPYVGFSPYTATTHMYKHRCVKV